MISFVIPAYNEETLLGDCIYSIRKALHDRRIKGEIIVVDNGSTDGTASLARRCRAKVVSQPAKGLTFARQAGHVVAKYDLVAHIDADNIMRPEWLDAALDAMNDFEVVAASGPLYYADLPLSNRIVTDMFYSVARIAHRILPMIQGGNFLMRSAAFAKIAGFDTSITFYGDDTDIAKRLSRVGKVLFVPDMWIQSSGRRLRAEGLITTGLRYIINYLSVHLLDRPWSTTHNDIRT
jgi:glycosyltransferase involved in cell wall biosynthesis